MTATLIFFAQHGEVADRIRALDGGEFTHVALSLGGDRILEAAPPLVRVASLTHRAKQSYRLAAYQLEKEQVYAMDAVLGAPYDWGWLHNRKACAPNQLHCATLIGFLFSLAGPRHPDLSLSELVRFCEIS